jgi:hypothetical protein
VEETRKDIWVNLKFTFFDHSGD